MNIPFLQDTTFTGLISAQTIFANTVNLSSISFTGETVTQPMSGTNTFIKVIVNNEEKFLPLFALNAT